jgi:hypothetical protein
MAARALLPLAALVGLTACSYDFDRASEVVDRRILGIQVEPPELVSGQPMPSSVQVRALVVDPRDPLAVTEASWWYCTVPERAYAQGPGDGDARCPDTEATVLYASGEVPLSAVSQSIPVPGEVADVLASGSAFTAPQLQVQLKVHSEEGDLYGIKLVTVTARPNEGQEPNRNPVLQGLSLDGVDWPADTPVRLRYGDCPDERKEGAEAPDGSRVTVCEHDIEPLFDEAAAQFFLERGISGRLETHRERLRFSWFTDAGSFRNDRTRQKDPRDPLPDNIGPKGEWREPPAKTERATIWIVVRDGRGGTHWERREVLFE